MFLHLQASKRKCTDIRLTIFSKVTVQGFKNSSLLYNIFEKNILSKEYMSTRTGRMNTIVETRVDKGTAT